MDFQGIPLPFLSLYILNIQGFCIILKFLLALPTQWLQLGTLYQSAGSQINTCISLITPQHLCWISHSLKKWINLIRNLLPHSAYIKYCFSLCLILRLDIFSPISLSLVPQVDVLHILEADPHLSSLHLVNKALQDIFVLPLFRALQCHDTLTKLSLPGNRIGMYKEVPVILSKSWLHWSTIYIVTQWTKWHEIFWSI